MPSSLDLNGLKAAAAEFAESLRGTPIPELFGTTDGKALGTWVEASFNEFLAERFAYGPGNAARGIDFPELEVDLKATFVRQPQSSCPFRDASQKIFGLGYEPSGLRVREVRQPRNPVSNNRCSPRVVHRPVEDRRLPDDEGNPRDARSRRQRRRPRCLHRGPKSAAGRDRSPGFGRESS